MSLKQELSRLAEAAPPPPTDTDHLIQLARRAKARRAVAVPLTIVLAALVITVVVVVISPDWSSRRAEPVQPPPSPRATWPRTTMTLRAEIAIAEPERAITALRTRAIAFGLTDPQVIQIDQHTLLVSVEGRPDEALLRSVPLAHGLNFRKILSLVRDTPGPAAQTGSPSTVDAVLAKLGDAYTTAKAGLAGREPDPQALAKLAPFSQLTGAEVELLEAEMQFSVPTISCAQLAHRPTFQGSPGRKATVCIGPDKVLLDVVKLSGDDVDEAIATRNTVLLEFTAFGRARLTELSREAFNNTDPPRCEPAAQGDQKRCRLAIMLGPHVLVAPEIQGVLTSTGEITADLTPVQANALADVILAGDPLPPLTIVDVKLAPY